MTQKRWLWIGGGVGSIILILVVMWSWVLLSTQPLQNPLARLLPWPVACTTRGCVTTWAWAQQQQVATAYTQSFQQAAPTEATTLTTILRQKLVDQATVKSPVTVADAQKYRAEILHITDEAAITARTGLTSQQYDTEVIIPFLKQEALRQQRQAETAADLYQQLAGEHWVFVMLRAFRWNVTTGQVVSR